MSYTVFDRACSVRGATSCPFRFFPRLLPLRGSSAEDRSTLASNAVPSNRIKATCFRVMVFKEYSSSVKKIDVDFKTIEPECLVLLECFYADVRTKKGGVYGRQAYMSARAPIYPARVGPRLTEF